MQVSADVWGGRRVRDADDCELQDTLEDCFSCDS